MRETGMGSESKAQQVDSHFAMLKNLAGLRNEPLCLVDFKSRSEAAR
jgi:hypothetical protein